MADTLESLEIEVKHKASGADSELARVTEQIKEMSRAIASALPQLKQYADTLGKIGGKASFGAKKAVSPLTQELRETINGGNKEALLGLKRESLSDALNEAFESGNLDKAISIRNQISNIDAELEKAGQAGKAASSGLKESAKATERLGQSAKKAQSPLSNFLSSLKRIAFYRFIRGIIKNITQAFSEGLQWAYQFSAGIDGEGHRFADALDRMKSASTQMKAQLGSAFISLLTIIEPILEKIIAVIVKVADAMAQLFAVFTGGTYLKATQTSQKFADTMKSGGSAAKEWKNQLLGFDVINRLNEPNKGGGGGGGSAIDPNDLFEEAKIDGFFMRIKQKFDELKASLNFEPLKQSWDRFKESIKSFADLVGSALAWVWENVLVPLAHWVIEDAAPATLDVLSAAFNFLVTVLEKLQPIWQWAWDNIFVPLAQWSGEVIISALETITNGLNDLSDFLDGNTSFMEFWDKLGEAVKKFTQTFTSSLGDGEFTWMDFVSAISSTVAAPINAIIDLINWIIELVNWIRTAADGLGFFNGMKNVINGSGVPLEYSAGFFAEGGFPEDGLFFANHGELVGQFSNGQTAVANNEQITEGIRRAVVEGMSAVLSGGNSTQNVNVYLDGKQITNAVTRNQSYLSRATGVAY